MTETSEILFERQGGVAVLTLNRPEKRNALTKAMSEQVIDLCEQVDRDLQVGALVVRGAGGWFCAGADRSVLSDASQDPARQDNYELVGVVYQAFMRVGALQVPTIAAVRGGAVGAGMNLLLATDLRILAEDARLMAGFLRIGIHPGGGHFRLMTRLAGPETAAALAIFGEELDGRRAVELGLAWQALPDDQVDGRALELAGRAAQDPALARMAVRSLRHLSDVPWPVALEAERTAQMWSLRRRYAREQKK